MLHNKPIRRHLDRSEEEWRDPCISLLLLFVLFTTSFTAHAAAPILLTGLVTDTMGAKISRAHIVLRTDFSGGWSKVSFDGNTTTDQNGMFELGVGSGFYDLCVMADAFAPQCRKIFIKDHVIRQRFELKVSPEVEKRIADKF